MLALVSRAAYNIEECFRGIKEKDLNRVFTSFLNQGLCSTLTADEAYALFTEMVRNTREYLDNYYDLSKLKI